MWLQLGCRRGEDCGAAWTVRIQARIYWPWMEIERQNFRAMRSSNSVERLFQFAAEDIHGKMCEADRRDCGWDEVPWPPSGPAKSPEFCAGREIGGIRGFLGMKRPELPRRASSDIMDVCSAAVEACGKDGPGPVMLHGCRPNGWTAMGPLLVWSCNRGTISPCGGAAASRFPLSASASLNSFRCSPLAASPDAWI